MSTLPPYDRGVLADLGHCVQYWKYSLLEVLVPLGGFAVVRPEVDNEDIVRPGAIEVSYNSVEPGNKSSGVNVSFDSTA